MAHKVNPNWQKKMQDIMGQLGTIDSIPLDETISYTPAAKWLVQVLATRGIAYKILKMGLGVNRITTKTDTCPCCKKKLT
jgi:hypothetical protein